jgi:uroporphyrinogen decarboxylase
MIDMATDDPRLRRLIAIVEGYNTPVIRRCVDLGAEIMYFGDDLGHQKSLPMGPALWRKFIKPSYARMLAPCRDRDMPVYLHTDGHVLEIIMDLVETGVRIVNPQIRANGLEGLRRIARGKVCIDQDLDRQLFPFATPRQVEDHIGEVFEGLYMKRGGLMLLAECGPDVPLANIEAICRTFERLCKPPENL